MPKVTSLGHVGLLVTDYPRMRDFYTRVLGFTVTDEHVERKMCFLSAQPELEHHEVLLSAGRTAGNDVRLVSQISFHVDSVAAVREFHGVLQAESVEINSIVTHGNTASIYFNDPEGNRLEVYYTIPVQWPQPFRVPIDIEQDDDAIMKQIHDATFGAGVS